ncbi:hypothetical protein [Agathobaculum sp.]|uniref:hypothetical protein n=1 Tax=Agathobaculum sp. TaxID=2048138 RepID=UPI002A80CB90|nr:hypothetical protein [Agathobaculum sp.]MDY3617617.1 hypothetical protein [Agathobaculum sp.]
MAGYYQKDFDYSEAIANTSDTGKRQQLLAERQNKIDAEGLSGKVASNDAVSTWTSGYRPYSSSSTRAGSLTVNGLYDAAERARLQRFEAERKRIQQRLQGSLSSIDSDYRAAMTQTDINARKSVIGNEEKLAALGLNMGARTDAATSGAAETSRIAVDNQYRGDLNALGNARLSARAAAQAEAADREAALSSGYYQSESDAALTRAQAALQQYNADRDYSLSVAGLTGFLNGTPTLGWREYQTGQDAALSDRQTQAYEQAFNRWKTYGYVLQSDAATLGVPAGTPTADASYKNASLSLQRWKAGYGY